MGDQHDNGATAEKVCFVISPIGSKKSDVRTRADQVLDHIIEPVVKECGYKAERSDRMEKSGLIGNQIIRSLMEADLVIADLTGPNANVMYELAIRHAVGKPTIHIIDEGDPMLPFDISQQRAIRVDHTNLDSVAACKASIRDQIAHLEAKPDDFDNPITMAIDFTALRSSGAPLERFIANISDTLMDVSIRLQSVEQTLGTRTRLAPASASISVPPVSLAHISHRTGDTVFDTLDRLKAVDEALDNPNLDMSDLRAIQVALDALRPENVSFPGFDKETYAATFKQIEERFAILGGYQLFGYQMDTPDE